MTIRTWFGATLLWSDPSAWFGGVAPLPDDIALINTGTATLGPGETVDAVTIEVGSAVPDSAVLVLQDALLGDRASIESTGIGVPGDALLVDEGVSGFAGAIDATEPGGTFEIATYPDGTTPGVLTLLSGAAVSVSGGDTMVLGGTLASHGDIDIGSGGLFANYGTIVQAAAACEVESGGTLGGPGLFEIGLYSSLNFQAGSAASTQNIRFTDVGGRLLMDNPANFFGTIDNFLQGDLIDLTSIVANAATYNPALDLLTVTEDGNVVATLTLESPAGDTFFTTPDGTKGTLVELEGTQTRVDYTIDAADRAMGGDTVRATMTTLGGVPLTGAGIRVGIISNSFDEAPGVGTADVANAAAEAGFLPETATGTSAVDVLTDALGSGDDNEGLALAELVHQVAPGASIDFATGEGGLTTFASAVTVLQQAGCNVIIDDLGYDSEPFFQDAGPLDAAINNAVASGVAYVAAAGNAGAGAYQATFTGSPETLYGGAEVTGQVFGNGTPYQDVTLIGGITATFDLQWAVPYQSTPGGATLQMVLYDTAGNAVATSSPDSSLGESGNDAGATLNYDAGQTNQFQLAIYGTLPAGTTFKYLLLGSEGGGSTVAGTIDDPAATAGTIKGHAMLPDVISAGAVDFPETPDFGSSTGFADYYSSTGPSAFLFDSSGDALASPQVVSGPGLLAPVDAATSVADFAPFNGTSAAAASAAGVAALMLQADPKLTPAQVQAILEETATSIGQPAAVQGSGVIDAPAAVQMALEAALACYAAGTRLATARGLVAIERLRVGDLLATEAGALRPVAWLGRRRVDCRRHPRPWDVFPVRVQAHAFAPQQPARDLLLSPDHAVKVGDALVPIRYLVNGASIAQVDVASVEYWHVELPSHDIVLAEGLPCESFLDTGNRAAFANGGGAMSLHPDFSRSVWATRGCAKLLTEGPAVAEAHARLLTQARRLGHRLGRDPGFSVRAGGRALPVRTDGRRFWLRLPAGVRTLRLLSRTWVPAHHGEADARRLGVAVGRLTLDGRAVGLADPRLAAGWHADEGGWRWTDGAATLVADGAREVACDLVMAGRYWRASAHDRIVKALP